MQIELHSSLFKNETLLKRLQEEFGGGALSTPSFVCSKTDNCAVKLLESSFNKERAYHALRYYRDVSNFLASKFPKTYKKASKV